MGGGNANHYFELVLIFTLHYRLSATSWSKIILTACVRPPNDIGGLSTFFSFSFFLLPDRMFCELSTELPSLSPHYGEQLKQKMLLEERNLGATKKKQKTITHAREDGRGNLWQGWGRAEQKYLKLYICQNVLMHLLYMQAVIWLHYVDDVCS